MLAIFTAFLCLLAFLSIFAGSMAGLYYSLWTQIKVPVPFAATLAVFNFSMLGIAFTENHPAILLLFAVSTVCWGVVLANQYFKGGVK
jgi:hypothetical protein